MLKIADMRNDVMAGFHNALYLGDARERCRILEEAGASWFGEGMGWPRGRALIVQHSESLGALPHPGGGRRISLCLKRP